MQKGIITLFLGQKRKNQRTKDSCKEKRKSMYCKNCGAKLWDGNRFCAECGTKVEMEDNVTAQQSPEPSHGQETQMDETGLPQLDLQGVFGENVQTELANGPEMQDIQMQPVNGGNMGGIPMGPENMGETMQGEVSGLEKPVEPKRGRNGKFIGNTIVAACIFFLVSAGLTGFFVSKYTDKKNAELKAEIQKELNIYLDFCDKAVDYKNKFVKLYLDDTKESKLKEKMSQAQEQIVNRAEEDQLKAWLAEMEDFVKSTEGENKKYVKSLEKKFAEYDTLMMTTEEEKTYNEYISKFKNHVEDGEYALAVQYASESYEYGDKVTEEKTGWNVSIVQQDLSSYPNVRLYLEITDDQGQVVENLDKKYFVLSEKQSSDEEYLKQKITKATQLNQEECLNISMVADVSGSMDYNMDRVKDVMDNFLENVQFEVGDQIELSSFCDDFQIEEYFTSDRASLISRVNQLEADGGTKLYDSLIEAAQRAYLQEGARCVIAFTDGLDNCSASTEDDVIAYAKQYNVPIFIIGIGVEDYDVYTETLRRIAEETGGFYRDVEDVSESLEEVYNSIYRQQKEVYCVGYKTDAEISKAGTNNVHLYIKGEENGGMADYSYTPKDDYFGVLLGKFLNAYSRSVENKDYSYLEDSDTLKSGGGIDTELRNYIKKEDLEIAQILHYEITDLDFTDKNTCIMTARESYDITQTKNYNSEIKKQHKKKTNTDAVQIYDLLMWQGYYKEDLEGTTIEVNKTRTLKGTYKLVRTKNGTWKFKDYAKSYVVESSDVYFACVEGDSGNWE